MYNYIKNFGIFAFLRAEFLPISASLLIIQTFVRLGSFAAELGCFLFVWYFLSYLGSLIRKDTPQ
jgi:hypothetical protein